MKNNSHIIATTVFATLFFLVAVLNVIQPDRKTYSEEEKRTLAVFPTFSLQTMASGEFFSGIDTFVSDTFILREDLITVSRKIDSLWSGKIFTGSAEDDIVFIPNSSTVETDDKEMNVPTVDKKDDSEINENPSDIAPEDKPQTETEEPTTEGGEDPPATEKEPSVNDGTEDTENTEEPENTDISDTPENGGQNTEEKESENVVPNPETDLSDIDDAYGVGEPEFLSSGEIIYNGAVYSIPYLVPNIAQYYADIVDYYQKLFPEARVSTLIAPLSSSMITDPKLAPKITDQNNMINTINEKMAPNINAINCFDEIFAHRDEYVYFRSDHHWTARGAYYAYTAFAESVGLEPTPLSAFDEVLLNSSWMGSMYNMTGDERVKEFRDEVYAYLPQKEHTMQVYTADGQTNKYSSAILTAYRSYTAFLDGDNPYTVINVPENPKEMTVLVLKDSYGRALIPYLIEHYSTIIVVDPRYIYFDIYELLKDYPLKDIIFANNIYNPNVYSYCKNLLRAVGQ